MSVNQRVEVSHSPLGTQLIIFLSSLFEAGNPMMSERLNQNRTP